MDSDPLTIKSKFFTNIVVMKTVLVAGDRIELSAVVSKASSGAMELINLLGKRFVFYNAGIKEEYVSRFQGRKSGNGYWLATSW